MRSPYITPLLAAIAAVTVACGDGPTSGNDRPAAASVALAELPDTLGVGDTIRAQATARASSGAPIPTAPIRWSSSNSAVAVVDSLTGLLQALLPGTVTVRARSGAVADSVTVRVERLARWIGLPSMAATITVGDSLLPTAAVFDGRDQQILGAAVAWRSSDTTVLRVTPSGYVKGVGDGIASLVATSGTASASREIDVSLWKVASAVPLVTLGTGWNHQCALTASGAAYCAGDNTWGQFGTGAQTSGGNTFVPAASGLTFAQIDANDQNGCGITAGGVLYCWGKNSERQVLPTFVTGGVVATPTVQRPGTTFRKVSLGQHAAICALGTDDVIYCWGHNDFMQVGRAPASTRDSARAPISGSLRFRDVAVAGFGGCGIALDGDTYCWGGSNFAAEAALPALVPGGRKFTSISAGMTAYCGLESGGAVYCWGSGVADLIAGASALEGPRLVPGGVLFAAISVGDRRACGLTAAGGLHCWSSSAPAPVPVAPRRTFRALDASLNNACAISTEGQTYCF